MNNDEINNLGGYISLYRKIKQSFVWDCDPTSRFKAWVDLLFLANFKPSIFYKRGVEINIKRGQMSRSNVELADRWGWSRGKVKRFLELLENEHQITLEKGVVNQLITIVNYTHYQNNGQQNVQQNVQQTDTYNKDNKDNKKKIHKKVSDETSKAEAFGLLKEKTLSPHEVTKNFFAETKEVIEYLNLKAKKRFNPESKSSKYIRGRFSEGYDVRDLKMVVDLKVEDWADNAKMKKYLRPDTLFNAEKFEKYFEEVYESVDGKKLMSALKEGDTLTIDNLSVFSETDWLSVLYTSTRDDGADGEPDREAIMSVKQIRKTISQNIGFSKFIEVRD